MNTTRLSLATSALAGLLFGAGLVLSGLADPARVLAFLTLGPGWDPTLLFVMLAALAVGVPGFALANRRGKPLFGGSLPAPPARNIDRRLLGGAALFGVGWGLAGYCPGPALVSAGLGLWSAWVFLPAMLAGAWLASRR
ncbi:MAG: DUF6691 family protein [Pseudomonadota bacterium]